MAFLRRWNAFSITNNHSFVNQKAYLQSAIKALTAFPVNDAKVEFISQSENISYRVRTAHGQSYVLRLHRPSYHNLAELESEQIWTEALLDSDIDVPVALRTLEGSRYARVECPDGWRFVGMLEWVEGNLLWDILPKSETASSIARSDTNPFHQLGRLIATLHDHATQWEIPEDFTRHSLNSDGFVGESPFWGRFWESPVLDNPRKDSLLSIRNYIKEILLEYESLSPPYSLIHADLHASNVVTNGPRLHIIDFDDSGFGWHAFDLAVALHNLRDSTHYDKFKSLLLDGYSDVLPISEKDIEMIELFLVVRSLASIGWVTARPDLNRDRAKICQDLYEEARLRLGRFES
ncbi:MAG: phosphotransferase [Gammaproteobacteria bacterium]|nr:phosphotransferase [Gammaproteobacteria bacterium]